MTAFFPGTEQEVPENQWGYGKRLRFVRNTFGQAFPGRPPSSLRVLDVGCGNGSFLALPLAHGRVRKRGLRPAAHPVRRGAVLVVQKHNATNTMTLVWPVAGGTCCGRGTHVTSPNWP